MSGYETNERPRVLEGVRVLDFTQLLAGPYCTRLMVDMGADVIKVERPPQGDGGRQIPVIKEGVSGLFLQCNAGKKSLCLDLKKPKSIELIKQLIRSCDVTVENFKVGVMDNLGLDYETLKRVHPGLIMCSISGYGQNSPYQDRSALATIIHASAGVTETLRRGYGQNIAPAAHNIAWADSIAAYHAFGAINAALFYRERTGIGQHIDISMFDSLFFTIDSHVQYYLMTGKEPPANWGSIPVKGRDGYLSIGYGKYEFVVRIFESMGRSDLLQDERFRTINGIIMNQREFKEIVETWINTFESLKDAEAVLLKLGVPVSRVRSVVEAVNSTHVESRGLLAVVDHPKLGKVRVLNSPIKFSETGSGLRGPAPTLGEHNKEILSKFLDFSDNEIEDLYEEKVLYSNS